MRLRDASTVIASALTTAPKLARVATFLSTFIVSVEAGAFVMFTENEGNESVNLLVAYTKVLYEGCTNT